jgi:hypothetical protein
MHVIGSWVVLNVNRDILEIVGLVVKIVQKRQIVKNVIEIIHVLYVLIENFSEKHVKIHVIIVLGIVIMMEFVKIK